VRPANAVELKPGVSMKEKDMNQSPRKVHVEDVGSHLSFFHL